jgi:hypothetical protein
LLSSYSLIPSTAVINLGVAWARALFVFSDKNDKVKLIRIRRMAFDFFKDTGF